MRSEVIRADTIGAAAERILNQLKEDTSTRGSGSGENVIYFDGWNGLCASAVLRTVAAEAPATLLFDHVIHVDSSNWVSRRALQRSIAKQLKLSPPVMDMFKVQDEEDDFNGVPLDSRDAVLQVREAMLSHWEQNLSRRFLVIFHNGSDYEIDLASFCGLPLYGYLRNTVLWTFQGRFRLKPRIKVDGSIRSTDIVLSATRHDIDPQELWSYLVLEEAADLRVVATCKSNNSPTGGIIDDQPEQIAECFLYMWKLCGMIHNLRTDYDLATHCCNYWICDDVIQPQQGQVGTSNNDDGGPRRAAHALQREMRLDVDYHNHNLNQPLSSDLGRCAESMAQLPHWTSPTLLCSYTGTIQFFPSGDMFTKVRVLKLSHCTFNFSASPFLRCHNLRFLWLDHCEDQESRGTSNGEVTMEDIHRFFQRLWVLDVRYTSCRWILSAQTLELMTHLQELIVTGGQDWDMSQLQGQLPSVCKVRINKSTIICSGTCLENNDSLFSWMTKKKMEVLDFSGNHITSTGMVITVVNSSLLETVIIDEGCLGVEQISFRGCTNLKNVLLRGLFKGLKSIDISGTAVKTLDLSEVEAKELDELVALGCGKLCAILWPPKDKMKKYLMKLHIGTTTNATSSLTVQYGSRAPTEYAWYVSVSDARLLRSLVRCFLTLLEEFDSYIHMEISTPGPADTGGSKEERSIFDSGPVIQQKRQEQPEPEISSGGASVVYADVSAATQNTDQAITQKWPEPRAPFLDDNDRYMYIQDDQPMRIPQQGAISSWSITVPDVICDTTRILHVHDSRSLTCVPGPLEGTRWRNLQWCRVERCPSLDCVFFVCPQAISRGEIFWYLHTLWCSQLPKVRCIWDFGGLVSSKQHRIDKGSFSCMRFMHVDMCPRLTHVLPPLSAGLINHMLFPHWLDTLEIVWCGDTRALFPLEEEVTTTTIQFTWLRRIHLRELPQLQGICDRGTRIYTPNLESIQIRGCWSLTRLPAVGKDNKKKVECDCEKEWWDKLKWDGMRVNHHPSLYKKTTHPRHYKKTTQLRTSVLR